MARRTSLQNRVTSICRCELRLFLVLLGGQWDGHAVSGCQLQSNTAQHINIDTTTAIVQPKEYSNCDLILSVVLPDSVLAIGDRAFYSCDNLATVEFGTSITSVGNAAFEDCHSLLRINFPAGLSHLGERVFNGCGQLTNIELGRSLTSISHEAFADCSQLQAVVLPSSVTIVGDGAFANANSLSTVDLGNNIVSVGNFAFAECDAIREISIPRSTQEIRNSSFQSCNALSTVILGDSVARIGRGAFSFCTSLTSINIPNSVGYIGDAAFDRCGCPPSAYGVGVTLCDCSPISVHRACNSDRNSGSAFVSADVSRIVTMTVSLAVLVAVAVHVRREWKRTTLLEMVLQDSYRVTNDASVQPPSNAPPTVTSPARADPLTPGCTPSCSTKRPSASGCTFAGTQGADVPLGDPEPRDHCCVHPQEGTLLVAGPHETGPAQQHPRRCSAETNIPSVQPTGGVAVMFGDNVSLHRTTVV
eukprot:m.128965 g.128965  ORF g.128965 m.128965 type:complete len:475 (-) comp17451_c0_seq1:302-1726(-)